MDMNKVFCALGVASAVVVVARLTFHSVYHQPLFPDTVTCASLVLLLVLVDVERLRPGKGHNFRSLVIQYIVNRLLYFAGIFMSNRLKKLGRDVRKHQRELLQDILKINRETEIAKHFSLHNVKDIEDYRSKMPLTKYKEYDAFASDVSENGSENVFFPGRPDYIALTSGTTSGKSKCFPKSMKVLRQTAGAWLLLSQKCFLDIERNNYLRKWLVVRANPKTRYCNGGIKTGPISGIGSNFSLNPYVVPDITNDLSNEGDVIYLNLVFGLKSCDICNLFFSTAQMALLFFQTLERRWAEICDDIERGEFTRDFGVPDHVREALSQGLNGADPDRANFLRQEIQKGFNGIVPRVWPECPGLFCLATGAFQLQADYLREHYLGHVPLFSPYHAGSETFYGINFDLQEPEISYTAMTAINFFEFIPVDQIESDNPTTLLCHQVKVGEQYEIVVTTYEGLYRYRTEDLVEITGFRGTIPKYKFIRRTGDVLSTITERVPETLLSRALKNAVAKWDNKTLIDFISTESINLEYSSGEVSEQPYYVMFVEIRNNVLMLESEKAMVDEELLKLHEIYANFRTNNKIGPLKVIQVKTGSFEDIANIIIKMNDNNTVRTQYKLPRIIRRPPLLDFLQSNTVT